MGYYMNQSYQTFFIPADKKAEVMEAIKELDGGRYDWVDEGFAICKTIKEMFEAWRWEINLNENGDIDDIHFNGEKLGDDKILFDAIAPFVEKDSYIEMNGEEGGYWRWYFKNSQCYELDGIKSFEDVPKDAPVK